MSWSLLDSSLQSSLTALYECMSRRIAWSIMRFEKKKSTIFGTGRCVVPLIFGGWAIPTCTLSFWITLGLTFCCCCYVWLSWIVKGWLKLKFLTLMQCFCGNVVSVPWLDIFALALFFPKLLSSIIHVGCYCDKWEWEEIGIDRTEDRS